MQYSLSFRMCFLPVVHLFKCLYASLFHCESKFLLKVIQNSQQSLGVVQSSRSIQIDFSNGESSTIFQIVIHFFEYWFFEFHVIQCNSRCYYVKLVRLEVHILSRFLHAMNFLS